MTAERLVAAFRAGFTRRWHTNPRLAHTDDRIHGHAGRVARIILMLHPQPSVALLRSALIHDDGESFVGDMPGPIKSALPEPIGTWLDDVEGETVEEIWGRAGGHSPEDDLWLRFADRVDSLMWTAFHAPGELDREDWRATIAWLEGKAVTLGVPLRIDGLVREVTWN